MIQGGFDLLLPDLNQPCESDPLVPIYLMSCYLYEVSDLTVIPDTLFDQICKILHDDFEKLNHEHTVYLNKDALCAGTGFGYDWSKLPKIIQTTANFWYINIKGDNEVNRISNLVLTCKKG